MILLQIRCYYGNDKDDNVSFVILETFWYYYHLKIMMEILNNFLPVGNVITFIISILQTFLICIFFAPFLHQRLWKCSHHALQSYGSSLFFIFWCKMGRKLTWISLLRNCFYMHYKMHFLTFYVKLYIHSFFFLVN